MCGAFSLWISFFSPASQVDIFINFHCTYITRKGEEITDIHRIRKRYLTSWFGIDVIAVVPFELLTSFVAGGINLALLNMTRIPRSDTGMEICI